MTELRRPDHEVESSSLPPLTFEKATGLLRTAHRDTLSDSLFGDAEVGWYKDGQEIACGYFGRRSYVTFHPTASYRSTSFKDDEAKQLRQLYSTSEGHSNNDDLG